LLFERARSKGVGIIARLPLSSGLLAGRLTKQSTFEATDHRNYNRHGEAFDRGETFSGIPFEIGLQLVETVRHLVPPSTTLASFCMRWILMQEAVTTAIPGAKRASQVEENVAAASLEALPLEVMQQLETLYAERVKPLVHHRW
jgi:aryl-alcohol dehydrogenase-like predicted oxidoreductase